MTTLQDEINKIEPPELRRAVITGQPYVRPMTFTSDQVDLIKRTIAEGASDDELKLFLHQAQRTGLDPLARQIYCVFRWANVQDPNTGRWNKVRRMTIQTSIDGFRLIADRTGNYAGQLGPLWCGPNGAWTDVWLDSKVPPSAAKVGILRRDFKEPLWSVALFEAYAGRTGDKLNAIWQKHGPLMVAKCAEALGLRRAFPQELSGLYTDDEMQQAAEPAAEPKAPVAEPDVMQPKPKPEPKPEPEARPPNTRLNIKQIMALEQAARAAAAKGSAEMELFWRSHQSSSERAIISGLASQLVKLREEADARLMAEAAAEAAAESGTLFDPETGETVEPPT
jgi:phage recombination protein Bet